MIEIFILFKLKMVVFITHNYVHMCRKYVVPNLIFQLAVNNFVNSGDICISSNSGFCFSGDC